MKRRISRRAMAERIAELEAANARLTDHLQVSLAISEHYLKQKIEADLAKRVADGPGDAFKQSMRSLYVYGAMARQPSPITPIIGGTGV